MRVAFRVDASIQIGSGHGMRCLTLAEQLRERGAEISFISRDHVGNLNTLIVEKGFNLFRLPAPDAQRGSLDWNRHADWLGVSWEQDARETLAVMEANADKYDWLTVDHYALDYRWEKAVRGRVGQIMVIDDLADRCHDCDLLLDQNLYPDMARRYAELVPRGCEQLLGPRYALLRPEFAAARTRLGERSGGISRILVFMGGSDSSNVAGRVLGAFSRLERNDVSIDMIIGAQSTHHEALKTQGEKMPQVVWHKNVQDMASLMSTADLAIGGGGTTTWERCALRLPTIIISLAANQSPIAKAVAEQGAAVYLGEENHVDTEALVESIRTLMADPDRLRRIGERSGTLVDAVGVQRVVEKILGRP